MSSRNPANVAGGVRSTQQSTQLVSALKGSRNSATAKGVRRTPGAVSFNLPPERELPPTIDFQPRRDESNGYGTARAQATSSTAPNRDGSKPQSQKHDSTSGYWPTVHSQKPSAAAFLPVSTISTAAGSSLHTHNSTPRLGSNPVISYSATDPYVWRLKKPSDKRDLRLATAKHLAMHGDEEAAIALFGLKGHNSDSIGGETELLEVSLLYDRDRLSKVLIMNGVSYRAVIMRQIRRSNANALLISLASLERVKSLPTIEELAQWFAKASYPTMIKFVSECSEPMREKLMFAAIDNFSYDLIGAILDVGIDDMDDVVQYAIAADTSGGRKDFTFPLLHFILTRSKGKYQIPDEEFRRYERTVPGFAQFANSNGITSAFGEQVEDEDF